MALEVGNQALLQAIYDLAAMPVLIVSGGSVLVCSFGNLNYPNLSSLSCALVAEKCIKTRPFPTFSIVTPAISHLHPIISSSTHPPKKIMKKLLMMNIHAFTWIHMNSTCATYAKQTHQKRDKKNRPGIGLCRTASIGPMRRIMATKSIMSGQPILEKLGGAKIVMFPCMNGA